MNETPDTPDAPALLTTDEVAAHFRVTPRTVRNWVRRGDLVPVKRGRVVRFRRADVIEEMDGNNVNDRWKNVM